MNQRRVVVTGLGVVACNGVGLDAFWRANVEGRSGITLIDAFPTDDFPSRIGGQVRGFVPADHMPADLAGRVDRFVHFGLACANMALKTLGSGWTWYVDGSPVSGQTSSLLSINTSPYSVGQHIVSCVVTYNGANYSGYLNVTVTQ